MTMNNSTMIIHNTDIFTLITTITHIYTTHIARSITILLATDKPPRGVFNQTIKHRTLNVFISMLILFD